jgi:site-specific DNA-methyltransferase (adenine-specific)
MRSAYYQDDLVTLYHGDCREWVASLEDKSFDCVITDPPFSDKTHESTRTNNTANGRRGNRVLSGSFGFDHIDLDEARGLLANLGRVSRGWVISNLDYKHAFPLEALPPDGLRLLRIGVWVKTNPNPQISGDRPGQGWESIAYLHRTDLRPSWNGGGKAGNFVLPSSQGTGHPTSKPLPMVSQFVRWFTNSGDLILDPYAGAGTTMRAAKDEGRRCIAWELEEKFCEIAARRLAQDTLFGGDVA